MAVKKSSPAAVATAAAATTVAAATKQTATKPAAAKAAATKQVTEPATEIVADTAAEEVAPVQEDAVETKFQTLQAKLALITAAVKELTIVAKTLQKDYAKAVKTVTKRGRKVNATKRSPSGFAKPAMLSDELCDFLKIAHKSERARTEVTRMINDYIKANNLQDPTDKRNIKPDDSLQKIMNLGEGDVLSYFNLQKYIKHHFVRAA